MTSLPGAVSRPMQPKMLRERYVGRILVVSKVWEWVVKGVRCHARGKRGLRVSNDFLCPSKEVGMEGWIERGENTCMRRKIPNIAV